MSELEALWANIPSPFLQSKAVTNRLVHLIPDQLAREVPAHILFAFPRSEDPRDGFVDVTASAFANAINRTSWYLESILGKAHDGAFPTVAYMGSSEYRVDFKESLTIFLTYLEQTTFATSCSCSARSKLVTRCCTFRLATASQATSTSSRRPVARLSSWRKALTSSISRNLDP